MTEPTLLSSLLALRNNTEQKSFVMVRIDAQQPKMTSRTKRFVWNWLRKYAQVHEGNDVDSTPPASTTLC
jgi:hypothetical protein